jgi:hypothetical protein
MFRAMLFLLCLLVPIGASAVPGYPMMYCDNTDPANPGNCYHITSPFPGGGITLPTYTRLMDGDSTKLADITKMSYATYSGNFRSLSTLSFNAFWDGTYWRRLTGVTMSTDNIAAGTWAPWQGSFMFGFDGSAWDRLRVGSATGLLVEDEKAPYDQLDDDETSTCTAITNASQQYTLPTAGDWYTVTVNGNSVYLLGGTNPTATTAANGHVMQLPEGVYTFPLNSAKIAFIANASGGEICFVQHSL